MLEQDEPRIADKYKDAICTLQVAERTLRPIEDADMIALLHQQKAALLEKLKAVAGIPLSLSLSLWKNTDPKDESRPESL